MKKRRKIGGIALFGIALLAFATPTSALKNYKTEDWKLVMPESECFEGESSCSYAAGSATKVDKTNKTVIKGNSYKGNKKEDANKWIAMQVGPYVEGGNTTIAQGINEEIKIELGTDIIKPQEFFELSFSLKNNEGEYVNEINVLTENVGEEIYIGIQGINTTGGFFNEDPIAKISEKGVYTYSWKLEEKNGKGYITFSVKDSEGKVLGTSEALEIDEKFKGNEVKPISEVGVDNVSVRWIWFCNVQVPNGLTVYSDSKLTVEPEVNGEDVTVSEEASEVLKESLEATVDESLKALLEANDATVTLEEKAIEKPTEDLVKRFESTVKGSTVTDYFDLSILVKVDGAENHYLTDLNKAITLTVKLPELPAVKKGYTRTYYILREHGGVVEKLGTTLSKDGKSISFASDKFSTYAIAYVDSFSEKTPETGDNIMTFIIVGSIAVIGVLASAICLRRVNE